MCVECTMGGVRSVFKKKDFECEEDFRKNNIFLLHFLFRPPTQPPLI